MRLLKVVLGIGFICCLAVEAQAQIEWVFDFINDEPVEEISVKVKLVGVVDYRELYATCGVRWGKEIFEYEIVEVVSGTVTDSIIHIIQPCPREMKQSVWLKNDTIYHWVLTVQSMQDVSKTNGIRVDAMDIDYEVFDKGQK